MTIRSAAPLAVAALGAILMGPAPKEAATAAAVCSAETGPAAPRTAAGGLDAPYRAIPLTTTRKIPGTIRASGTAGVASAPSPYGVAVGADGSYTVDVHVSITGLRPPARGHLVAWVTTPQIDRIQRLGPLNDDFSADGRVTWNQFLVIVTLEADDDPAARTWSGPIAFRGVSRSGLMHTMAGHGPFQQEWCAKYGYD